MGHNGSTSLDALETSDHLLPQPTNFQRKLFRWDTPSWQHITSALCRSATEKLQRRGRKINECSTFPALYIDENGESQLSLGRCRDRLCPFCARARGASAAKKAYGFLSLMNAPRFLTLTIQHSTQPLVQQVDNLMSWFRELRKTKLWKETATGGIYSLELTRNLKRGEWHPHLHIIFDGYFMPHSTLKDVWESITGGSNIVHIKAIHNRKHAADYIAEYIAKAPNIKNWAQQHVCEFAEALHSRRMINTFGNCHGKKIDSKDSLSKKDHTRFCPPVHKIKEAYLERNPLAQQIMALVDQMPSKWRILFERNTTPTHERSEQELVFVKTQLANLFEQLFNEIYPYSSSANKLKTHTTNKSPPQPEQKLFEHAPNGFTMF